MKRPYPVTALILTLVAAGAACSGDSQSSEALSSQAVRWTVAADGTVECDDVFAIGTSGRSTYSLFGECPFGNLAAARQAIFPGTQGPYPKSLLGRFRAGQFVYDIDGRDTDLSPLSRPLSTYLANGGPAPGRYFAVTAMQRGCSLLEQSCDPGAKGSGWIVVKLEDFPSNHVVQLKIEPVNTLMNEMKVAALALAATKDGGAGDGLAKDAGASPDGMHDSTQPRPDGDPPPTIDGSAP